VKVLGIPKDLFQKVLWPPEASWFLPAPLFKNFHKYDLYDFIKVLERGMGGTSFKKFPP
jgi:hypothetical protein